MPTASTKKEQIDERILRILGLNPEEVEMDYITYHNALRESLVKGAKSGLPQEELEVNLICPDDGQTEVKKKIGLEEIMVLIDDENNDTIDIDDSLKLKLKFPSLDEFIKSNFETGSDDTVEASFDLIASCIDKIYNDEEIWEGKDSSKKELRDFIDQLSSKQFKEIEKFFETMPKLSYTTKITNPNTKVESEVTLEGLASFFA